MTQPVQKQLSCFCWWTICWSRFSNSCECMRSAVSPLLVDLKSSILPSWHLSLQPSLIWWKHNKETPVFHVINFCCGDVFLQKKIENRAGFVYFVDFLVSFSPVSLKIKFKNEQYFTEACQRDSRVPLSIFWLRPEKFSWVFLTNKMLEIGSFLVVLSNVSPIS